MCKKYGIIFFFRTCCTKGKQKWLYYNKNGRTFVTIRPFFIQFLFFFLVLTIERLRQLQDIIKVTTLAEKAGLNSNSIRAKLHSNREKEKLKKKPRQSIIDFADHAVKLADDFKKLMDMFVDLKREQENAKRK